MAYAPHQQTFFDRVWNAAVAMGQRLGVDPRIIYAQAALESNWGRSGLSKNHNNFFGIKARAGERSVTMRTREVVNGASVYVNAAFRKYDDVAAGLQGYADFITRNPRYRPFVAAQGLDAELAALQASGYATDPLYSRKLKQVINNMPEHARNFVAGAVAVVTGNSGATFCCPKCGAELNVSAT